MFTTIYKMRGKVWLYKGMGPWHFVTIPKKQSDEIKKVFGAMKRGWGSLPVIATIGKMKWKTSIFPDNNIGAYILPIKSEVRKKERIKEATVVSFSVEILV